MDLQGEIFQYQSDSRLDLGKGVKVHKDRRSLPFEPLPFYEVTSFEALSDLNDAEIFWQGEAPKEGCRSWARFLDGIVYEYPESMTPLIFLNGLSRHKALVCIVPDRQDNERESREPKKFQVWQTDFTREEMIQLWHMRNVSYMAWESTNYIYGASLAHYMYLRSDWLQCPWHNIPDGSDNWQSIFKRREWLLTSLLIMRNGHPDPREHAFPDQRWALKDIATNNEEIVDAGMPNKWHKWKNLLIPNYFTPRGLRYFNYLFHLTNKFLEDNNIDPETPPQDFRL